jgi:hypothetical protein
VLTAGLNCPQGKAGWMHASEDPEQGRIAAARVRA